MKSNKTANNQSIGQPNLAGLFLLGELTLDDLTLTKDDSRFLLFDQAYSCHVQTVPVLSYALTAKNQYNDMELEQAVSIVDMAKAAGYETVWLSNQVHYGAWDTPISVIGETADYHEWINSHVGQTLDTDYYDGELLEHLKDIPKSDKMLIVLHLMGIIFRIIADIRRCLINFMEMERSASMIIVFCTMIM